MPLPIFGPGHNSGDNATTDRPPQKVVPGALDTWFQNCTSEAANDGTRYSAEFANFIIANFRAAVRGLGVTGDTVDDDLLLKCFQACQDARWINLPFFPEILQSGNVLGITDLGGGLIRVDGGQAFLHRGWHLVATSDYDAPARTLNHSANKTYHVRWLYNAGAPYFTILDVADGVYNPGALDESDAAFDSTYDDMLIARVTTDGANVPAITLLKNKAALSASGYQSTGAPIDSNTFNARMTYDFALNWARRPQRANMAARRWCQMSHPDGHDLILTGGTNYDATAFGVVPVTSRYRVHGLLVGSYTGVLVVGMDAAA